MTAPLPCPDCDGGLVVDFDRHDRGRSSGAPHTCSTCHGANVAKCWWRFDCQGVPATQIVEGHPACDGCAVALDRSMRESETCFYCMSGDAQAVAGPERAPACSGCIDAFHEVGVADTERPPAAPDAHALDMALLEMLP